MNRHSLLLGCGSEINMTDTTGDIGEAEDTDDTNSTGDTVDTVDTVDTGDTGEEKVKDTCAGDWGETAECPAMDCLDLTTLRDETESGNYWLNGSDVSREPVEVFCEMTLAGGGWTRLEEAFLLRWDTVHTSFDFYSIEVKYLYAYEDRWYRSPTTLTAWSWTTFRLLSGVYDYGTDGDLEESVDCDVDDEDGHWGVGCSEGPGDWEKVLPWDDNNAEDGLGTICQDQPDHFGVSTCADDTAIYFRRE